MIDQEGIKQITEIQKGADYTYQGTEGQSSPDQIKPIKALVPEDYNRIKLCRTFDS